MQDYSWMHEETAPNFSELQMKDGKFGACLRYKAGGVVVVIVV